ncbi:hypothetical protein DFR86_06940 [Acidianus sulfidivorans JP7]|uniref:Uncharacterized protein n=1 Tax=Acidianus sulfidivorans JP7 TaxID=619593 RepID=A0A2U9IMR2_9CREN|nr:hypothetical protein [Acidianus sulfidivorans]AWR97312.1 hypothetical protein DFR86_06940 [Acidianus sulfidivorans JP7]
MNNDEGSERQPCFMRKDLYEELKNLANESGISIYKYTNEILEAAIDLEKNGIRLNMIRDQILLLFKIATNYKGLLLLAPFSIYKESSKEEWRKFGKEIMAYLLQFSNDKRITLISTLSLLLSFIADINVNSTNTIFEARSPLFADEELQNTMIEIIEGINEIAEINIRIEKQYGSIKVKLE